MSRGIRTSSHLRFLHLLAFAAVGIFCVLPSLAADRVSARQPMQPKGIAGVGLTAEQVNAAIDRGADFLWAYLKQKDLKNNGKLGQDETHILVALALVHANAHKRYPDFDSALRDMLDHIDLSRDMLGVYRTGLLCMLIESYGDGTYLPKLRQAAQYLIEGQAQTGSWMYTPPIPRELLAPKNAGQVIDVRGGLPLDESGKMAIQELARTLPLKAEWDGDNSVSQFAVLGLQAAARSQFRAPQETWQRSLAAYSSRQGKDGGWPYHSGAGSYGSMTCAGICAIAINRFELGEKDPAADERVERGLGWLDKNFSVSKNPQHSEYDYYYIYSLERTGRILDTEFVGSNEWYPLGARYLVDQQKPDGSWIGNGREQDPRLAGSFALLFLTRATPSLQQNLARGGNGTLKTGALAETRRLYIILDASGSMIDPMDGKAKFDVARDAVRSLMSDLSPDTEVALRVYGHRKRSIDTGADEDTELVLPMNKLDPAKFSATLARLRARGRTPLALSLEQAARDLSGANPDQPVTVLLLTDGGEDTFNPRGNPLKAATDFGKLKGVRLHVVGFDINREDWSKQLHEMSERAGGTYWPAFKAQELITGLRAAVLGRPDAFAVLDKDGKSIQSGHFGQALSLPEGHYTLQTDFAGQTFKESFWINTGVTTALVFDSRNVHPANATAAQPAPTSPAAAPPGRPKFCSNCGAPLPAGVKFCPKCGHKVE